LQLELKGRYVRDRTEAGQDRRQGRRSWPLRHVPDGRGRRAPRSVPGNPEPDRRAVTTIPGSRLLDNRAVAVLRRLRCAGRGIARRPRLLMPQSMPAASTRLRRWWAGCRIAATPGCARESRTMAECSAVVSQCAGAALLRWPRISLPLDPGYACSGPKLSNFFGGFPLEQDRRHFENPVAHSVRLTRLAGKSVLPA
jgi:hypothetical protein